MQELAANWYAALGGLNSAVAGPLRDLADGLGVPLIGVLLLGLIGATSPCQLTTNAGALAYVVGPGSDRRLVATRALAYLVGKALVYTIVGAAVILAGQQLAQSSVPIIIVARKALGPLMILLGLCLAGVVPLRLAAGQRLSRWIQDRTGTGVAGAFLLGIAFAFAFCPTLFLLFFGLTIPLALTSTVGGLYPAVFALGATAPLLGLAGLLTAGVGATRGYLRGAQWLATCLRPITALVLMLAGLNDTLVYWLL